MTNYIKRFREVVNGYRTVLTAVGTILTSLVAWAAGETDLIVLIAAIGTALEAIFIRLGLKGEIKKTEHYGYTGSYSGAYQGILDATEDTVESTAHPQGVGKDEDDPTGPR